MKLFDRFDKVYCINLDRRPDRMEKFDSMVKECDLGNYTRFSAIDGALIKDYVGHISLGAIGLIMSNLEIIKKSIEDNLNTVLILEDDCYFTDEIKNIDTYFKALPDDWDMLYMGSNYSTTSLTEKINDKVLKLNSAYTTHFVAIKNTMFETIYLELQRMDKQLDVLYCQLQINYNVYGFTPAIAKQRKDYSDIENVVVDYNQLIK